MRPSSVGLFLFSSSMFGCGTRVQDCDSAGRPPNPVSQTPPRLANDAVVLTPKAAILDVRDFGARGDGVTDDTAALQQAMERAQRDGKVCYLSRGTYLVSKPLITPKHGGPTYLFTLRGDGNAVLKATSAMEAVITTQPTYFMILDGFQVNANHLAQHGIKLFHVGGQSSGVRQVQVSNALSHGFVLQECQILTVSNLTSNSNGGDAFRFEGCNAMTAIGLSGVNSKGNGVTVQPRGGFTGGMDMYSVHAEGNAGHGISIESAGPVSVQGGWVEGNGGDGIHVASNNVVAKGVQILGAGTGRNWAIHVQSKMRGSILSNNFLQGATGDTTYASVRFDDANSGNVADNNFQRRIGTRIQPIIGPPNLPADTQLEATGAQLLKSPGMEAADGWLDYASGTPAKPTRAKAHAGRSALLVTESRPIIQNVRLVPGSRYRFSAWILVTKGEADLRAHGGQSPVHGFAKTREPVWVKKQVDFVAYGTGGYVHLGVFGDGAKAYFDDAELYELRPTQP